jgi:hypothetical protein
MKVDEGIRVVAAGEGLGVTHLDNSARGFARAVGGVIKLEATAMGALSVGLEVRVI